MRQVGSLRIPACSPLTASLGMALPLPPDNPDSPTGGCVLPCALCTASQVTYQNSPIPEVRARLAPLFFYFPPLNVRVTQVTAYR